MNILIFFSYICGLIERKMKKYLSIVLALGLAGTFAACNSKDDVPTGQEQQEEQRPTLVTQVQKCARLYTTEYRIHKIVTHDDVLRLKGSLLAKDFDIRLPLGERKIAFPMDATLKAYIDFGDFSERNVERDGDHITIVLPDPQVVMTSSKINQKEVREYVGLTRSHFTDKELTAYEQQGRQAILNSIPQIGIVEAAQENAARVLVPMLVEMGYQEENITIAFRKDLNVLQLMKGMGR